MSSPNELKPRGDIPQSAELSGIEWKTSANVPVPVCSLSLQDIVLVRDFYLVGPEKKGMCGRCHHLLVEHPRVDEEPPVSDENAFSPKAAAGVVAAEAKAAVDEDRDQSPNGSGGTQTPSDVLSPSGRGKKKKRKKKSRGVAASAQSPAVPSVEESPAKAAEKGEQAFPESFTVQPLWEGEKEGVWRFWEGLELEDREALLRVEKEALLGMMFLQQRRSHARIVSRSGRAMIEEELELLYRSYPEELKGDSPDCTGEELGRHPLRWLVLDSVSATVHPSLFEGHALLALLEKMNIKRQQAESVVMDFGVREAGEGGRQWEEGKRMLEFYAARLFEHLILTTFREKTALEQQELLLAEEENVHQTEEARQKLKATQRRERRQRRRQQQKQVGQERIRVQEEKERAVAEQKLKQRAERAARRQKELDKKKREEEARERAKQEKRLEEDQRKKKAEEDLARRLRVAKEEEQRDEEQLRRALIEAGVVSMEKRTAGLESEKDRMKDPPQTEPPVRNIVHGNGNIRPVNLPRGHLVRLLTSGERLMTKGAVSDGASPVSATQSSVVGSVVKVGSETVPVSRSPAPLREGPGPPSLEVLARRMIPPTANTLFAYDQWPGVAPPPGANDRSVSGGVLEWPKQGWDPGLGSPHSDQGLRADLRSMGTWNMWG